MVFSYDKNKVYFIQKKETKERSLASNSDRKETEKIIHNNWLSMDIIIEENKLQDGNIEYSATIHKENVRYRIFGKMPEKDFDIIISGLSY